MLNKNQYYLDCRKFPSDIQGGIIVKLKVSELDDCVDLETYNDKISITSVQLKTSVEFEDHGTCNTCEEELPINVSDDKHSVLTMSQEAKDHFRARAADGTGRILVGHEIV